MQKPSASFQWKNNWKIELILQGICVRGQWYLQSPIYVPGAMLSNLY